MWQSLKMITPIAIMSAGLSFVVIGVYGMQRDFPAPPEQVVLPAGQAGGALPADEAAARQQARLLHEAFHATLQFVHQEYYRPDEKLTLPSATLERVFGELEKSHRVKLHWLAVNAKAMNVDHEPQDEFEREAVAELSSGKAEVQRVQDNVYRFAGAITLTSDCLKCHLPGRTSTKERAAALAISIPLKIQQPAP